MKRRHTKRDLTKIFKERGLRANRLLGQNFLVDHNVLDFICKAAGVAEGDIELTVHDGVVTVQGEKKTEREEEGETWYFSERQYGAFSRSFRLPPDADEKKVDAGLKDGVLTISVPKSEPRSKAATTAKIKTS